MTTLAMSQISLITLALLPSLLLLAPGVRAASYGLKENYFGDTFFDAFDFFTDSDPTHGFVTYIDRTEATNLHLAYTEPHGAVHMGVDSSSILDAGGAGRKSIRIESKKSWTHGLFIADIQHMPGGICGTWPAFWMFGPNWPNSGEIDIIEGVNSQKNNIISMHTSPGCTVAGNQQFGTLQTSDCDANQNYNSGCGTSATTPGSYGTAFNQASGGVYATEWTSDFIRVWFFSRDNIPSDIKAGNPDPSGWGTPEANFQGDCDIDSKFKDHRLIFDTTFCGDWGNAVWSSDPVCSSTAPTCNEFVAGNPQAFADASWSVNYVRVFESLLGAELDPVPGDSTIPDELSFTPIAVAEPQASANEVDVSIDDYPASYTATIQSATAQEISHALQAGATELATIAQSFPTSDAQIAEVSIPPGKCPHSALNADPSTTPSPPIDRGHSSNHDSLFGFFAYIDCIYFIQPPKVAVETIIDDTMTIDFCLGFCHSLNSSNYAFIGGPACYCSEVLQSFETLSPSACNLACPGNSAETCGGIKTQSSDKNHRKGGIQESNDGNIWKGIVFSLYGKRSNIGNLIHGSLDNLHSGLLPNHHGTKKPLEGLLGGLLGHKSKTKHPHFRPSRSNSKEHSSSGTPNIESKKPALDSFAYGMGGDAGAGQQQYTKLVTTTYVDECSCAAKTLTTRTVTTTLTFYSPAPTPAIQQPNMHQHYKARIHKTNKSCSGTGCKSEEPTLTIPITRTVTRTKSKAAVLGSATDKNRNVSSESTEIQYTSPTPASTPTTSASVITPAASSADGEVQTSRANSRTKSMTWGCGVWGAALRAVLAGLVVIF